MKSSRDQQGLTEEERHILQALVNADGPSGAGDIAAATGLEAKTISRQIAGLRQRGLAESPERCKYAPTNKTGAALLKATGRLL